MKNRIIFFALILLVFTACKKDNPVPPTTYQIENNLPKVLYEVEPLYDGSIYEVEIFWYNNLNVIIKQYNLSQVKCGGGKSPITEVTSDVVKVRVSFRMLPTQSDYYNDEINNRMYVVAYFSLKKGGNTLIPIDEQTVVANLLSSVYNPSKLDLSRFKALLQK
jgi:hypothetical protein